MTVHQIRAGSMEELHRDSGKWAFVDVGFSRESKTGGLLIHDDVRAAAYTFDELKKKLCLLANESSVPLNLVLEAPLSVAFTCAGNPAGRSMEKADAGHRYWYAGLGCQVTVAAAYLVRAMKDEGLQRDIRLFEGFVSFKVGRDSRSHERDVLAMRSVAWADPNARGHTLRPDELAGPHAKRLESAFKVFGFDCQVPPVIVAGVE